MGLRHPGPHSCCTVAPGGWSRQGGLLFAALSTDLPFFSTTRCDIGCLGFVSFFFFFDISCPYVDELQFPFSFLSPMTLFNLYISSCSLATRQSRSPAFSHRCPTKAAGGSCTLHSRRSERQRGCLRIQSRLQHPSGQGQTPQLSFAWIPRLNLYPCNVIIPHFGSEGPERGGC